MMETVPFVLGFSFGIFVMLLFLCGKFYVLRKKTRNLRSALDAVKLWEERKKNGK